MAIPRKLLEWRETQRRGSIMRPSTFKKIVQKAKRAGYKDPYAVAGKAYWTTLRAKAKRAGVIKNPVFYYIGVGPRGRKEIFATSRTPTRAKYGHVFKFVVGPFPTIEDAQKHKRKL